MRPATRFLHPPPERSILMADRPNVSSADLSKGSLSGGSDLGQLAETITGSVLRAVGSREEFRNAFKEEDSIFMFRPEIWAGGWVILAKGGQIQNVLNQQFRSGH
jgi:hypothetical protein